MAQTETSTRISQVGTVIVPVSDQDKALDFYVGTLGFEKRIDVPYGDGDRWIAVAPPGADTMVAIVPPREGEKAGIETRVGLTSDDVEADHETLKSKGVDVDDVMRMGDPVPDMFFMRDPDGNTFFVVQGMS